MGGGAYEISTWELENSKGQSETQQEKNKYKVLPLIVTPVDKKVAILMIIHLKNKKKII